MEDLSALIVRLSAELAQCRRTRDRIERSGLSGGFGGVAFTQVNYEAVLRRITALERELFRAEAQRDDLDIDPAVRVSRVSQY